MIVNIVQYESGSTHLCYWRYFFVKNRVYRQKLKPGGLLGMGLFNSRQKHFYLPEPQTDFIFSIISEEFGVLGVIIVVSLFTILLYRCIKISLRCEDRFNKYLSFGLVFQIIIQTILNLSVVIGLIPVTGVTLPFLSYGGSSLLISSISMGIILSISKNL